MSSSGLDRNLTKTKNEAEELLARINELMHKIEHSDIIPSEKSIFANDFSNLTNDVASLNETILNSITNDNVDLESFVVAPERLSVIETLNFLIVDKEKIKLQVKEEDVQVRMEDTLDMFDEGDETANRVRDINTMVSTSLDSIKKIFR